MKHNMDFVAKKKMFNALLQIKAEKPVFTFHEFKNQCESS